MFHFVALQSQPETKRDSKELASDIWEKFNDTKTKPWKIRMTIYEDKCLISKVDLFEF